MLDPLKVLLSHTSYDIHIGSGILDQALPEFLKKQSYQHIVVVTNTILQQLYPHHLERILKANGFRVSTCVLPDGESYKNLETLNLIYDFLLEEHANRRTLLIAFGGGVIGDMTGFAAATFMRGIPYLQVPTTLLAQVDSSVGGKTAVNHRLAKNSIGSFKQPVAVYMDLVFLKTLPQRELRAGFFELIKYGIIHDFNLFQWLTKNQQGWNSLDFEFLEKAIHWSCRIKASIVEVDEHETGVRALLNFGHTLGHLLEAHTHYHTYLHGEAVGIGMLFASFFSHTLGFLSTSDYEIIRGFLIPLLPAEPLPSIDAETFQRLLLHDKKSEDQTVQYILIRSIGEAFIQKKVSPQEVWNVFLKFNAIL